MEIREYRTYDEQEMLSLYTSVGWTAYTDHPDALHQGLEHSLLTLAAYENGRLVGLIRTVGDGYTIVLVQDILVFPEYQRTGIGTALMRAVLDRFCHVRQIQLATDDTPKTIAFYNNYTVYYGPNNPLAVPVFTARETVSRFNRQDVSAALRKLW